MDDLLPLVAFGALRRDLAHEIEKMFPMSNGEQYRQVSSSILLVGGTASPCQPKDCAGEKACRFPSFETPS
jgi:hypothetical protein